jgi:methyltransferase-like protein
VNLYLRIWSHLYNFYRKYRTWKNSRKRKFLDKRIKHVNYGIEPKAFNSLTI